MEAGPHKPWTRQPSVSPTINRDVVSLKEPLIPAHGGRSRWIKSSRPASITEQVWVQSKFETPGFCFCFKAVVVKHTLEIPILKRWQGIAVSVRPAWATPWAYFSIQRLYNQSVPGVNFLRHLEQQQIRQTTSNNWAMVGHTVDGSKQISVSSRPDCSTEWVLGLPGPHRQNPILENKIKQILKKQTTKKTFGFRVFLGTCSVDQAGLELTEISLCWN